MAGGDAGPSGREGSVAKGPAQPGGGDASPAAADAHTNEERRLDALSVLWTLGKCLGAVLPVYLAGYYRVSTSLVAFGLVVYTGWRHTRDAKEARLRAAMRSLGAEEDHSAARGLSRGARDSPSWIGVPDVEKVEWLNKVLQQAWPFVGQYLEKLLVETIAPSIRASSTHLQTLSFTKIDMGSKAMKVVGIKAHTENDKGQVLLDVHISYVGDVEINVEIKRYFCKAGVKGIQLHGMMRVILEPLIGDVPIVGAVTMFFIRRPKLDINWTGLTNLLDIPGLNVMSDTMIMDAIASFLVLPNRLTVPLVPNLPVAQLRCPLPRGVVRIHLLEAENLAAKDNYVKGMISGMSDPYTIIRVGPQTFKSHHVDNSLSPKWGEMYEVIVHEVPGQELEVEVYDKDPDQDDFLGRTKVDLGMVKKARVLDEWFPLKDTSSGRVHLKMEWLCLLPSTEQLDQVIQRNKSVAASSKTTDPPSAAILVIYLDRAEALPMKKGNKEPSPMVQLSIQDVTRESRTCFGTTNPEWGDAFTFFIHDPRHMDIDIQVKDNDRVLSLGSLSIPLSRLLTSPDLSLDQWFQLENSEASSRISLHAVLRVLWLDEEGVLRTPLPWDAETFAEGPWSGPGMKAQKTSPNASFATEGVLRIHLVEARNLISKDKLMGGIVKGKSDPYVKTRVGGMTFRSNVIEENLNPTWNELYEVVLTQTPGQEVQFELYDKDIDSDDFLGSVHVVMEWVPTVQDPSVLGQVGLICSIHSSNSVSGLVQIHQLLQCKNSP
uniref:Extended synaptotagmin 1 n=1 Tax=Scleropages formosus TaxID=113540 RepID=A0A8C9VTF2_SCLFO